MDFQLICVDRSCTLDRRISTINMIQEHSTNGHKVISLFELQNKCQEQCTNFQNRQITQKNSLKCLVMKAAKEMYSEIDRYKQQSLFFIDQLFGEQHLRSPDCNGNAFIEQLSNADSRQQYNSMVETYQRHDEKLEQIENKYKYNYQWLEGNTNSASYEISNIIQESLSQQNQQEFNIQIESFNEFNTSQQKQQLPLIKQQVDSKYWEQSQPINNGQGINNQQQNSQVPEVNNQLRGYKSQQYSQPQQLQSQNEIDNLNTVQNVIIQDESSIVKQTEFQAQQQMQFQILQQEIQNLSKSNTDSDNYVFETDDQNTTMKLSNNKKHIIFQSLALAYISPQFTSKQDATIKFQINRNSNLTMLVGIIALNEFDKQAKYNNQINKFGVDECGNIHIGPSNFQKGQIAFKVGQVFTMKYRVSQQVLLVNITNKISYQVPLNSTNTRLYQFFVEGSQLDISIM